MKAMFGAIAFFALFFCADQAQAQSFFASAGQTDITYDAADPGISLAKHSSLLARDPSGALHGLEYSGVRFNLNDGEYIEFGSAKSLLWLGGWNIDPKEIAPAMSLQYIFFDREIESLLTIRFWSWPNAGLSGNGEFLWKLDKHFYVGISGEAGATFDGQDHYASIGPAVIGILTNWLRLSAGLIYRNDLAEKLYFIAGLAWLFQLPI